MNYLTIIAVVLFCLFMLMYVGSSKDNYAVKALVNSLTNDSSKRFIIASPNGELSLTNTPVTSFQSNIDNNDQAYFYMLRDEYKKADAADQTWMNNRVTKVQGDVTNAYKAADVAYYKSNQTDAQGRANAARASANNNTALYYVKKNTNYTVTADGAVLGRGHQDNWGERYVTWTGSKGVKKSKILIK